MGSLRFRFADEEDSVDHVARLAADMQQYDAPDVLCGGYIYRTWRPDLVSRCREQSNMFCCDEGFFMGVALGRAQVSHP